jgi:hypothetical protein
MDTLAALLDEEISKLRESIDGLVRDQFLDETDEWQLGVRDALIDLRSSLDAFLSRLEELTQLSK